MPVIGIPVHMLNARIASRLSREAMVEKLQHLGCDVEGYATVRRFQCTKCDNLMEITETENPPVLCDRCGADFKVRPDALVSLGASDVIRMEALAVRPDIFEPGGMARLLRNYLEETLEPASYALRPPTLTVKIDPGVNSDACRRPAIACAVIRDVTLDEDLIKVIMKLQENLHWALGRDRKHASIGVYDLDTLKGDTFSYDAVAPESLTFTPLAFDPEDPAQSLTPAAILETHPKGITYKRLLASFTRYPLLRDASLQVLSMPPVINSEQTRVRRSTRNFFVDVTGSGERIVQKTLNILVTSLLELDSSAHLEQVRLIYPDREVLTPGLTPQEVKLDPAATSRLIGVPLTTAEVIHLLKRMGHAVREETDGLLVRVPAYRNDIMHPRDLMEDVAIAYGYHRILPCLVPTLTVGQELPLEARANEARRAMTGLGFLEIITLPLTSPEENYDKLRQPRGQAHVVIDNPITLEQSIVRTTLLSGLLETLSINTNQSLPQRLFEVGSITLLEPEAETGAREWRRASGAAIGPLVDYGEIRSTVEALLREFGYRLEVAPDPSPTYIPGRGALIFARKGDIVIPAGSMGEVHPEVLEFYHLSHPTSVFEVELEKLVS